MDRVRAAQAGASVEQITQTLALALSGAPAGVAAEPTAREAVEIVPRLARERRSSVDALLSIPVATASGPQPLARFVHVVPETLLTQRMRKNLRPVIYVTGDVAGAVEAPVYAILDMNKALDTMRIDGRPIAHLQRRPARPTGPDRDEVGRRVAGDDRGVPRPRARLRRGADAHLRARGRVVPVVHDSARDHGADPAHAHRHSAGARDHGAPSSRRRR